MGYPVAEVLRPKRDKRRKGKGGNDEIDAEIAARDATSGNGLAIRRNALGMSQKAIAEKLGVPNARISEIEREKRLHPEIRAEYDRLLNTLLENRIQA